MTGALRFAEFRVGTRILIDGSSWRVTGTASNGGSVVMRRENGSEQSATISLAEFYARVCDGSAQTADPIVRPDLAASMPPVTIDFLSRAAQVDWYHRMILIRGVLHLASCSPRSAKFKRAFEDARRLLDWVRKMSGVSTTKSWTAKRTNDLLRNWRHHGGAIASLLVQCVPARRRKRTSSTISAFQELVRSSALKYPDASIASVHRVAGARLRTSRKAATLATPTASTRSPERPSKNHAEKE